jgi:hypothetical protein
MLLGASLARRAGGARALAWPRRALAHGATPNERRDPKNPGDGGGFFGLNPVHRQSDAQKFDTFHAGHALSHPLELQGSQNPAGPDFNATVWRERNPLYTGKGVPPFGEHSLSDRTPALLSSALLSLLRPTESTPLRSLLAVQPRWTPISSEQSRSASARTS